MLEVITFYLLAHNAVQDFVTTIRPGGIWREMTSQLPGFLGVDLLQCRKSSTAFLLIEFWSSEEAYRQALNSPSRLTLSWFLTTLCLNAIELGTFAFPPDHQIPLVESAQTARKD